MKVEKIAIIGSGIMGNGISQVASVAGYKVALHDVAQEALDRALETIRIILGRLAKKGKLTEEDGEKVLDGIQPTTDLAAAVSGAQYVIEAVTENLELKCQIFTEIDRISPPNTIIASNTSQYSITEIAGATERPDRILGTHFFNPPVMMRLIEVVRGIETSEDTVETTLEIAKRMGKEVVLCADSQGFITSRLINLWCNEAERIVEEGIASAEDVDKACRLAFNHPMGPLELSDFSGLDTRLNVTTALESALGERFKPTRSVRNLVNAGRLGRKTGRGFYDYSKE